MKKILAAAVIAGLVAVPGVGIVSARQGADDINQATDIRREGRQGDHRGRGSDDSINKGEHHTMQDGVKVETEVNLPSGSLTLTQATTIAKQKLPGKTIEKVVVENEHGAGTYSVRFTDNSRVDIRTSDGEVTRVRDRAND